MIRVIATLPRDVHKALVRAGTRPLVGYSYAALEDLVLDSQPLQALRLRQLLGKPEADRPIEVVRQGKSMYVIDGRHRVMAALRRGELTIAAKVYDMAFLEQLARERLGETETAVQDDPGRPMCDDDEV